MLLVPNARLGAFGLPVVLNFRTVAFCEAANQEMGRRENPARISRVEFRHKRIYTKLDA